MTPELKTEWVAALRSGDYKQARNYLCTDEGYCCLGVLCEVRGYERSQEGQYAVYSLNGGIAIGGLTGPMAQDVGLKSNLADKLMLMNDGEWGHKKHSFLEIADWIEENL